MTAPGQRQADVGADFPPHVLREYAFLADGERGALVGPRGDIVWMCAPRWDSDAVFANLVGGRGLYAVTPIGDRFVWGGYYEDGTLIWRDRWITSSGIVECREALAFPADPHRAVLLRRIVALRGPAQLRVVFDAAAGFGRHAMAGLSRRGDCWTARSGPLTARIDGLSGGRRYRGGLVGQVDLAEGACHDLVVEISDRPLPDVPVVADLAWQATESAWGGVVPDMPDVPARRDVRHAYAVLTGLTTAGGGMVAAATTSLPERAEQGRNYDYRYAWIRDQCFAGQAVAVNGPHPLLDASVAFVSARLLGDGPQMKPAYRVDGSAVPDEQHIAHLPGYPGATVTTGNWVNGQFQLDAFGEAMLLFASAAAHGRLGTEHWRAVETAASAIEARWTEPDAGIWEIDPQHWAHSRLMCVAGLRAAATHATSAQASRWTGLADTILADVGKDSVHQSGRWQRSPADARVDAALLLGAVRGAVAADDPRAVATVASVERELVSHGYVYRFRQDDRPLEEAEGAFLLCGFVMALAVQQQGRTTDAVAWFERTRASCGSPGLLTEELDVIQRQLRGNIPQAFVHALLVECASRLGPALHLPS